MPPRARLPSPPPSQLLLLLLLSMAFAAQAGQPAEGHDYSDALRKSILFFEGQRSGKLPPDQRLRWRGDSALRDGAAEGLMLSPCRAGGPDRRLLRRRRQHKVRLPMAFTATLLSWSVIDFGRNMGDQLGEALRAVRWATDYILKATAVPETVYVQVGDAFRDHGCWERPEDMDTPRTVYKVNRAHPGSDVAGESAAALAAASIVFRFRDPAYSRRLLDRAVEVFEFADKYRGAYSSSLRPLCDELLWGAAWLHKASRRREYREYILRNEQILGAGDTINEFGWDNKHAGINVLISKEVLMGKAAYLESFKNNADSFICSLLPGMSTLQTGGSNMQHVTSLSFLLLAYSNYLSHSGTAVQCGGSAASPAELRRLAKRQFPRRIHHRGSSLPSVRTHPARIGCKAGSKYYLSPAPNPNLLVGAVVGGPNTTDAFPDSRPYFQQSEPTTYINAPFVGLLAYFSAHSHP
ncbi:unnamed protein product [Spirodela intermedia]|uniref:Endoglucanase n=1 Tax=Spirodela intermedia TaxID=51605 RepID=A0A7I8J3X8_SPIIN|nr:unnamed protein product [Spirodela intermedia]CAA6664809.1 unnamed protein product [Spirodela intermedia]